MTAMTPRQRDVFGWPPVGDPYWNAQTLAGVGAALPRHRPFALRRGGGRGAGSQAAGLMKIDAAKVIVTCPGRNFVTLKITPTRASRASATPP